MKPSCRGICLFLLTFFLLHSYSNQAQTISIATDPIDLNGIPLIDLVDYIKGHYFSIDEYLKKKGYQKDSSNDKNHFYNAADKSSIYLSATMNGHILPKSIATLKQEYIAIRSNNNRFKDSIEKIIYDLKIDDNFSADIDARNEEYSFYSIKKDFYIKIVLGNEYSVVAVY
jgi:hypothetical protein